MPTPLLYLVLTLLWGSTFLWTGIATLRTSPFVVADVRLIIGALTAATIVALMGRQTRAEHSFRALRPWFARGLVLSLLQAAVPFVLLALAQREITSGVASILNSAAPLFVALVAIAGIGGTWEDRLPGGRLPGLVVGIAGVAVLMGASGGPSLDGEVLMVGMVMIYASGGLYAQRVFRDAPRYAAAMLSTGMGAVALVPLCVVGWIANPPDLAAIGALVALGVGPTGIAYVIYFELIRRIGTTRSLTVTYLMPVVANLLGAVFLDEAVRAVNLAGLVLILLGVAIVNGQLRAGSLRRRARPPPPLPPS